MLNPDLHEFAPEHSRSSQFCNFHVEVHADCEEKGQPRSDFIHLIIVFEKKGKLCDEETRIMKYE
jgi:hypothetical protein